ncbi:1-phosphofructokinase family hexose kinase [Catellatospora tritici]|uniref:1-phosphofructokinase family hexose kinase n=1 Tax=Catellatospora tritici TaxID=2851566 RepID=UPI001C2D96AF|nr:hexose kinase [Catellatospora tritici]MBV1852784.1 hexose kinase [Catellatospora tritici]
MILTVTLNVALDVTYTVDRLVPHSTHRVTAVAQRAGGKGVNVARVLHALGEPVVATGLAGGPTGARVRELLTADGIAEAFAPVAADARRTVVVGDGEDATGFWEPGPVVTPDEWQAFTAHFSGLLPGVRLVVLSGSLPAGVPEAAYAELVALAHAAGADTILDADGAPLRHGLSAAPNLVKPNAYELRALTGLSAADPATAAQAVAAVRDLGARDIVASLGAGGLAAATADGRWRARLPHPLTGNPTGAGDACVAALARAHVHGLPWPQRLREAVAVSAAAVAVPYAGAFDPAVYRDLHPQIEITPWATPAAG